jgi:hypothetical protein
MSNELSTPPSLLSQQTTRLDTRPTSLAECIDEEGLKAILFLHYRQRRSDESDPLSQFLESLHPEAHVTAIVEPPKKRAKKGFEYLDENGELVPSTHTTSLWYKLYVANAPTKLRGKNKQQQENKFRRRFCLPYQSYGTQI